MKKIFDFQSHSRYHAILPTCKNKECFEDIKNSKKDLKKIFKYSFDHFSYPNGDYTNREVDYIKKYNLLKSHTARRSFATNKYKAGKAVYDIMHFTGHTTEKEFYKYRAWHS